jgi:hypothetical protein
MGDAMKQVRTIPVCLAAALLCTALAPLHGQGPKSITACDLLSGADIRRVSGRTDVAMKPPQSEPVPGLSNCQHPGKFDVSLMLATRTKERFAQMRDTYAKAPPRAGYAVESVSGIGEEAYFAIRGERVQLHARAAGRELTVEIHRSYAQDAGELPPQAEVKQMAVKLAKVAVAKLR